jgi:DNA-binding transcriptional LysR family regulator
MNVTVRQLRAFVALAQLGGFTRAAARLHLTQSAVSLLVQQLESQLDIRLVERTTRSVELTDAGRALLPSAERMLGDLQHALKGMKELVAREKGRVVLAAPLLLSSAFLPKALAAFRARHPSITVLLTDSLPQQVLPNVRNRSADLGLGTFAEGEPDLDRVVLFKDLLVAVAPNEHPAAHKRRLAWADLAGTPLIFLTRDSVFRSLTETGFQAAGMHVEPAIEVSYVGTALGLAQEGFGIAIVPGYARALVNSEKATWKPLTEPQVDREVSIVRLAHRPPTPAAAALADFLVEYAQQQWMATSDSESGRQSRRASRSDARASGSRRPRRPSQ